MLDDVVYMRRALELAQKGLYTASPNPRVGCVIVNNGQIVGEGFHAKTGEPHAETYALEQAGAKAKNATCYVTLEPCAHTGHTPPCVDNIIKQKLSRVVIAMADPNPKTNGASVEKLKSAGISVTLGVEEAAAMALNPGFIKRMQQHKPFIRAKIAVSLDGRTAMASGESKWITSEQSREDVQHWRARSDAIVTGIGTVLADNPKMSARVNSPCNQPLRVVVDRQNRLPKNALIARDNNFLHHTGDDLHLLVEKLNNAGVNEVLVESGPSLLGAFIDNKLLDELIIYQAPKFLGHLAKEMVKLPHLERLSDHIAVKITDFRQIGPDLRLIYQF